MIGPTYIGETADGTLWRFIIDDDDTGSLQTLSGPHATWRHVTQLHREDRRRDPDPEPDLFRRIEEVDETRRRAIANRIELDYLEDQ